MADSLAGKPPLARPETRPRPPTPAQASQRHIVIVGKVTAISSWLTSEALTDPSCYSLKQVEVSLAHL